MLGLLNLLLLGLLFGVQQNGYENYKVLRITLKTGEQQKAFEELGEDITLDFWKRPTCHNHTPTDVMVSPEQFKKVGQFLQKRGLTFQVINENVGITIHEEKRENDVLVNIMNKRRSIVGTYARYNKISDWLSKIANRYGFCSVINIGESYENRSMYVLKIATGANKPVVFVDAGIHAREWLSTATIVYVINQLVKDYAIGKIEARSLLDKFEFQFLPVVNPDGYEYSFLGDKTRLWRKNRKQYSHKCSGVDLNRNFDAEFGGIGTSNNPCSEIFPGPHAFSEPETQHFRDHILSIKDRLKLYLSTHAYGQLWLVPFGYTARLPEDDDELRRVANIGNDALYKTNGVRFEVGSPPELLYSGTGSSYDWLKAKVGVKYSYSFELRPGLNYTDGAVGFMTPVSEIVPSGREIYNAIKATADAIRI